MPGAEEEKRGLSLHRVGFTKRLRGLQPGPSALRLLLKAVAMAGCSSGGWLSPAGRSGLVKSRLFSLLYLTLRLVSLEKLILRVQQPL